MRVHHYTIFIVVRACVRTQREVTGNHLTSTKIIFFLSLSLDVDVIQTATDTADSYTSDRLKEAALKDSGA